MGRLTGTVEAARSRRRIDSTFRARPGRWSRGFLRWEKSQLVSIGGRNGVSAARIALICIRDAVLVAQARHQLGQTLAKGRRKKCALLVAFAITRDEMWELVFKEG